MWRLQKEVQNKWKQTNLFCTWIVAINNNAHEDLWNHRFYLSQEIFLSKVSKHTEWCMWRQKLCKSHLSHGNVRRSCTSTSCFYLPVCPHFGLLLSRRPPDNPPLFRWIHINTSQNDFKFWQTQESAAV